MNCENCGASIQPNATHCRKCGSAVPQVAQAPPAAQQVAQQPVNVIIQQAPAAGQVQQAPPGGQVQVGAPVKSKITAGLLGILLGAFGIHRFYLGYTGIGLAQLLITVLTCGYGGIISGTWGLIDGIRILTGSIDRDAQGRALKD